MKAFRPAGRTSTAFAPTLGGLRELARSVTGCCIPFLKDTKEAQAAPAAALYASLSPWLPCSPPRLPSTGH